MILKNSKELDSNFDKYVFDCRLRIGENIRKVREKKGYNQKQLAEIMQVSRSTISKIENGKFNCSLDYISKFSWFLEFDLLISIRD
jgi:transcriptional regulator with XRE-family HTH domain